MRFLCTYEMMQDRKKADFYKKRQINHLNMIFWNKNEDLFFKMEQFENIDDFYEFDTKIMKKMLKKLKRQK